MSAIVPPNYNSGTNQNNIVQQTIPTATPLPSSSGVNLINTNSNSNLNNVNQILIVKQTGISL